MKKSVKKCLVGLVAVPMAVMLVGCSKPATVKAPFDSNPHAISGRTYSNQTEITSTDVYTNNMAAPEFTTSTDASVASVASTKEGGKAVVINNVTQADYEAYEARVNPEEGSGTSFQTAEVLPGEYVVTFDDGEVVDGVGTMYINYTPEEADLVAAPTAFKTLNLALDAAATGMYMKMIMDGESIFNEYLAEYCETNEMNTETAIAALALLGITPDSFKTSIEVALRQSSTETPDMAMGMYVESPIETYNMHMSMIDETLRLSMHLPTAEAGTASKIFAKYTMEEVEGTALEMLMMANVMMVMALQVPASTYEDLLTDYAATGYEMIDGKSYYYETFGDDDMGYTTYYFNGEDLIYIGSEDEIIEVLMTTNVPSRMFETKVPTGYVDKSAELLQELQAEGGFGI